MSMGWEMAGGMWTTVGGQRIQVVGADYPTLVFFASGKKAHDNPGAYAFWSAHVSTRDRPIIARARVGLDAGERFDRMCMEARSTTGATKRVYEQLWYDFFQEGKAIKFIRPSLLEEVSLWGDAHRSDWRWARQMYIGGKMIKVRPA